MIQPTQQRPTFPVLGSRGAKVDLQMVKDHGKQANANHYQTVEQLAARGGLGWCELCAVLENRPWVKMDTNTAIERCRAIEARYLAAVQGHIAAQPADWKQKLHVAFQVRTEALCADQNDFIGAFNIGALAFYKAMTGIDLVDEQNPNATD